MRTGRALALGFIALAPSAYADPPRLYFPVECAIGRDCLIQNFVDHDPSSGVVDFQCGSLTYDGHNGTDIRLPDLRRQREGVAVLAAADGVVLRSRDGVPDISVRDPNRPRVDGQECGNGVVIAHADDFETQYCHLAQGSLRVRPGERVTTGQAIGRIGLSGNTEYPHLHFTVRHKGQVIDPFAVRPTPGTCGSGGTLWHESVGSGFIYKPGAVLNVGFAAGPVTMEAVEAGDLGRGTINQDSPALVGYVRAVGLKKDDVQHLSIRAPAGDVLVTNTLPPLDRDKAQTLVFAGKRRPPAGWGPGIYQAEFTVTRAGRSVLEERFTVHVS